MINKDLLLKRVSKIEDKLFVSKVLDKAKMMENQRCITHTDFLDPYQQSLVEKAFSASEDMNIILNGGYSGAERVVLFFLPDFFDNEDVELDEYFTFIRINPNTREALSHRDYLGGLMSLGIKREKIGDILVGSEFCTVVVKSEIAEYIKYNLVKVANAKVDVSIVKLDDINIYEPKLKEIKATVASLRLDSVSGVGFGMSRSKISEFIKSERLSLNWEATDSPSKQVKEGDTISIRGKGKVVLEKVGNKTRKDRINVTLKKFV